MEINVHTFYTKYFLCLKRYRYLKKRRDLVRYFGITNLSAKSLCHALPSPPEMMDAFRNIGSEPAEL